MPSHQLSLLENVDLRRSEIRTQLSDGNLKPSLRRLHDFAADFGTREQQNEVVLLDARLSQMRRDIRQFGIYESTSVECNKINADVLSLIDEIVDHHEETQRMPPVLASVTPITSADTQTRRACRRYKVMEPEEPPESPSTLQADGAVAKEEKPRLTAGKKHRRAPKSGPEQQPEPFSIEPLSTGSLPVFTCRGLGKDYGAFSLSGVDLDLHPGNICGLVGINGAGKTTLLRMIAGELRHSQGDLTYPGLHVGSSWHAIRNQIAYVQQSPPTWYGPLEDNLAFVAAEHGLKGADNRAKVERVLYRLTLDEYRRHTWSQISGGYKMRFELARALLSQPRLLVLDEPLSPLDVVTQQLFLEDLRHLTDARHRPMAVILSSQNLHEVEGVADQLLFLDGGQAVFCGNTDDLAKQFGDHLFELQITGSSDDIERALELLTEPAVDVFGQCYYVTVPKQISGAQVLHSLLDAGVKIDHFRDISHSTRRLFNSHGGDF